MKKLLCVRDSKGVLCHEDIIEKGKFYLINDLPFGELNKEIVYEYNNFKYIDDNDFGYWYIGIFCAKNFIDLAEHRDKQIDIILNED